MSTIKLPAASGGGSISIKGPSSSGSDTDLLDTSGNVHITGNLGVGTSPSHLVHIEKDTGSGAAGTKVIIENPNTNSVNNNVELYLKTARGDFGFKHYNATESYIQVPDQLIINTNNATSATQALHIDTSQNVKVSNGNLVIGTSGKGIDFSATSDATGKDNELLDDYEEGTFTPRLGGNSNIGTYNVTGSGNYIKIGSMCHVMIYFDNKDLDNSASGIAIIDQLPFTSVNTSIVAGVTSNFHTYEVVFSQDQRYTFYVSGNSTSWKGLISRNDNSWANWDIADFENGNMYLEFHGSYRTA